MRVTIADREAMRRDWGSFGPIRIIKKTIDIPDTCPVCGGLRGKPEKRWFFESGNRYAVDCWSNPCGHVDKYEGLLREV